MHPLEIAVSALENCDGEFVSLPALTDLDLNAEAEILYELNVCRFK